MPRVASPQPSEVVEQVPPGAVDPTDVEELEEQPENERLLPDGYPNPKLYGFWEYLDALTTEQWDHHSVYVYRKKPRTELLDGAPGKYIGILTDPFTIDDLKEEFGGEVLQLFLNRDSKEIMRIRVGVEAPPRLRDYEKLVAEEKAKAEATAAAATGGDKWAERHLSHVEQELEHTKAKLEELDPSQTLRRGFELMNTVQQMALKATIDNLPKQPSIVEIMDIAFSIQKAMAPPPPPAPAAQDNKLMELMFQQQTLLLTKLLERNEPAPRSHPLEAAMTKIAEQLIQRGLEGGETEKFDWREKAFDAVVQHAPALLDRAVAISANVTEAQRLVTQRHLAAQGLTPPPAGVPGRAPQPVAPVAPAAAVPQPDDGATKQAEWNYLKIKLVKMLLDGVEGESAAESLENFDADFAEVLAEQLRTNPAALMQDTIFRQGLVGINEDRLRSFIESYLGWFTDDGEKAREREPAPVPAAGAPS